MLKFIHVLCNRLCASIFLKFNSIIHLIYHFPCLQAYLTSFLFILCVQPRIFIAGFDVCARICEQYLYLDNCVISAIFGKFSIQIGRFPCTLYNAAHKACDTAFTYSKSVRFRFTLCIILRFSLLPLNQSNFIRIFDQKMPRNVKATPITATTYFDGLTPHCTQQTWAWEWARVRKEQCCFYKSVVLVDDETAWTLNSPKL